MNLNLSSRPLNAHSLTQVLCEVSHCCRVQKFRCTSLPPPAFAYRSRKDSSLEFGSSLVSQNPLQGMFCVSYQVEVIAEGVWFEFHSSHNIVQDGTDWQGSR